MEKTHTKLPWKHKDGFLRAPALENRAIISVHHANGHANTDTQSANMDFAELSCNMHYELVEALERTTNVLEAYMRDAGDLDNSPELEEPRKLIAKARG